MGFTIAQRISLNTYNGNCFILNVNTNFKTFFETYYSSLVAYASAFLSNNRAASEDLVQDVFVTLWKGEQKFPNELAVKTYLYKMVRNKCLNIHKHNLVKQRYAVMQIGMNNNSAEQSALIEDEIVDYLYRAINKLPKRKNEIIKLTLKGMSNKDIAQVLDIKIQTVKTLKYQAYTLLRNGMQKKDIKKKEYEK